MKKKFVIVTLLLLVYRLSAQPSIQWQKCLGGTESETARDIQQTNDDGFIVVGFTTSNNGDVSGQHGGGDWWVVKLDALGDILWQRALGGSSTETANAVCQTIDGGYIVAGQTFSNNGDVSNNHGDWDYWVVKLNALGQIQWQKTLGGSGEDRAYAIQQTTDRGYVVTGYSASTDGDITQNIGYSDVWLVKLDSMGEIEWDRSYGGTNGADRAYSLQLTKDGGYVFAGETTSSDGDVEGHHGNDDCWVVKLDSNGDIQWQRALGGIGSDRGWRIVQTSDEGFAMIGYAGSPDGDVTGWQGNYDYWVVKLSVSGALEWQKTLGGSDDDYGFSICQTNDGEYAVVGTTHSMDGDVLTNHGQDVWAIKLDSTGEIKWQKTLGGSMAEVARKIFQTTDGGYVIVGETYSNDGDASGNHGGRDFWVVKLSSESVGTEDSLAQSSNLEIYPNPASHSITLQLALEEPTLIIRITDLLGRQLSQQTISNGGSADIATLPNGLYIVTATTPSGIVFSGNFRKME